MLEQHEKLPKLKGPGKSLRKRLPRLAIVSTILSN